VFDDALVEVKTGFLLRVFAEGSTIVADPLQDRSLRRKRAAIEALGPAATSTQVAEKIRGATRIPLTGVHTAELTEFGTEGKGAFTIRTSAGEELVWIVLGENAELAGILTDLLGTRLTHN